MLRLPDVAILNLKISFGPGVQYWTFRLERFRNASLRAAQGDGQDSFYSQNLEVLGRATRCTRAEEMSARAEKKSND